MAEIENEIEQEIKNQTTKENTTPSSATTAPIGKLPPKITRADLESVAMSKKGKALLVLKAIVYNFISAFLIALSAYSLITPNNFTIGGAAGLAILINVATNGAIPQSLASLALNFPLIILSFFFVKKKFALLTSTNIIMQSICLSAFEYFLPTFKIQFTGGDSEKIFAALAAGICIGIAIALAFKVGGSTGGADILAVMIQKRVAATSISFMLFAINFIIIASSLFVYYNEAATIATNLLPIMLSAFEAYIESKTNESISDGFQSAIEFRIITSKPEEMSNALMHELSRGVTSLPATGMYTNENYSMLICVVSRRQAATVRRISKTVDPDSFAVMSKVSQVLGLGFYSNEL